MEEQKLQAISKSWYTSVFMTWLHHTSYHTANKHHPALVGPICYPPRLVKQRNFPRTKTDYGRELSLSMDQLSGTTELRLPERIKARLETFLFNCWLSAFTVFYYNFALYKMSLIVRRRRMIKVVAYVIAMLPGTVWCSSWRVFVLGATWPVPRRRRHLPTTWWRALRSASSVSPRRWSASWARAAADTASRVNRPAGRPWQSPAVAVAGWWSRVRMTATATLRARPASFLSNLSARTRTL